MAAPQSFLLTQQPPPLTLIPLTMVTLYHQTYFYLSLVVCKNTIIKSLYKQQIIITKEY